MHASTWQGTSVLVGVEESVAEVAVAAVMEDEPRVMVELVLVAAVVLSVVVVVRVVVRVVVVDVVVVVAVLVVHRPHMTGQARRTFSTSSTRSAPQNVRSHAAAPTDSCRSLQFCGSSAQTGVAVVLEVGAVATSTKTSGSLAAIATVYARQSGHGPCMARPFLVPHSHQEMGHGW